jgi:glycosyltransferase involved in cell wall biosynthesis
MEELRPDHVLLIAGWVIAGLWLANLMSLAWHGMGLLRPGSGSANARADADWPEVTIVVPARNEQSALRPALSSLLKLDYPNLRIVAVDDRSTDQTGPIMDELAAADPRLQVIHLTDLPPGWLGKNHASFLGASQTRSPWILFTDADVLFHADALKVTIDAAEQRGLHHLVLVPGHVHGGFWENLMVLTFGLVVFLHYKPWLARIPSRGHFIGLGAFNLVSRKAYEAVGTHKSLAMEVADDLKLGKRIKQHGFRQDVFDGRFLATVRWQVGLRGVVRGMTKNAFAGLDYSLLRALTASASFITMCLLPYVFAILAPGYARLGFIAALCLLHGVFFFVVWANRLNPLLSCLLPVSLAVFLFAVWRSVIITCRNRGVRWRGTFYPLDDLRRGPA